MISLARRWKWPPRIGEPVISRTRWDIGLRETGKITQVRWRDEQIVVKWDGRKVVSVINCFEWNGHTVRNHHYRIDGIMYPSSIARDCPNMVMPGGDVDWFEFQDFEGRWESSEGGRGAWII